MKNQKKSHFFVIASFSSQLLLREFLLNLKHQHFLQDLLKVVGE